ncbi:hypothetical protein PFISCL1PPCAC_1693, partial [Pristionchus fissidentatus]
YSTPTVLNRFPMVALPPPRPSFAALIIYCLYMLMHPSMLTSSLPKFESSDCPRVAVIGAGMAGFSAARRLKELGVVNVDIYEALDRIGGRTQS